MAIFWGFQDELNSQQFDHQLDILITELSDYLTAHRNLAVLVTFIENSYKRGQCFLQIIFNLISVNAVPQYRVKLKGGSKIFEIIS